jgi:carbonic anhydrase
MAVNAIVQKIKQLFCKEKLAKNAEAKFKSKILQANKYMRCEFMQIKNKKGAISRREAIQYGGGFFGTGLVATILGVNLANSPIAKAEEVSNLTPDEALEKLLDGNQRFSEQKTKDPNQSLVRLQEVAKGQNPFAAILSCADSRVPPEIVFDRGLGDLFVVRNAGNVATPEEIGSLEFGTLVLGAKVLMVIGHESCGAIKATLKGGELPGQIGSIVEQIQPATESYQGQQDNENSVKKATDANILMQIERLKQSTVISQLIAEGKLKVVGGYYDLDEGKISLVS